MDFTVLSLMCFSSFLEKCCAVSAAPCWSAYFAVSQRWEELSFTYGPRFLACCVTFSRTPLFSVIAREGTLADSEPRRSGSLWTGFMYCRRAIVVIAQTACKTWKCWVLAVNFRHWEIFARLIFVTRGIDVNFLTTKISQSTVLAYMYRYMYLKVISYVSSYWALITCADGRLPFEEWNAICILWGP